MKRFIRFLAAVLTAIFLSTSAMASNYSLIVSMAAEQAALKDISNLFPVGITLYSDSFPECMSCTTLRKAM
jgi:outer membrane lipoprotein-sorting protein